MSVRYVPPHLRNNSNESTNNNLNESRNNNRVQYPTRNFKKSYDNKTKSASELQKESEEKSNNVKNYIDKIIEELNDSRRLSSIKLYNPEKVTIDETFLTIIINSIISFDQIIEFIGSINFHEDILRKFNTEFKKQNKEFTQKLGYTFDEQNLNKIIKTINLGLRKRFISCYKLLSNINEQKQMIKNFLDKMETSNNNIKSPMQLLVLLGFPSALNIVNQYGCNGSSNCAWGWCNYMDENGFEIDHNNLNKYRIYSVDEYKKIKELYQNTILSVKTILNNSLSHDFFEKLYQKLLTDERMVVLENEEKLKQIEIQNNKFYTKDSDEEYDDDLVEDDDNWDIVGRRSNKKRKN